MAGAHSHYRSVRSTRRLPLAIFWGTTAIPSSRAAAEDRTISWVSVSFAMVFSSCLDSIRCHQHDPAMAQGRRGSRASWRAPNYRSVRRTSPVRFR